MPNCLSERDLLDKTNKTPLHLDYFNIIYTVSEPIVTKKYKSLSSPIYNTRYCIKLCAFTTDLKVRKIYIKIPNELLYYIRVLWFVYSINRVYVLTCKKIIENL